jgi:hypothetical protein
MYAEINKEAIRTLASWHACLDDAKAFVTHTPIILKGNVLISIFSSSSVSL